MAVASLFRQISKSQNFNSTVHKLRNFSSLTSPHCPKPFINPFQGRPISTPAETLAGFGEMVSGAEQKYFMLSKIGDIGKTSCVTSHAVKFANQNYPTIGVCSCPTYLLGDSFDQYTGGIALVPIQGMHSPLLPIERTSEKTKEDLHSATQRNDSSNAKDFMDRMGLGILSQQLEELQLGELLITPPVPHKELPISNECYAAALSSFVDAVLEYTYFVRSSATSIHCASKKIKFAKQRRGRMKGISHRGNHISFGNYALQVLEAAWITSKQIEAGRRALSRIVGRGAKIWVRVIPDKPVTARPAETRMGRGKGSVSFWVAVVQPGRILYEISGVSESIARKAVSVAASKLPVQTRFIISE